MANFDRKLANILVKRGYLDAEARDELLATVEQSAEAGSPEGGSGDETASTSLSELLLAEERIDEAELIGVISAETNLPPINLSKVDFDPEVLQVLDAGMAAHYRVIPISKIGNTLTLAVADPFDVLSLDDVKIITKHDLIRVVSTEVSIKQAIEKAYKDPEEEEPELQIDDMSTLVSDIAGVGESLLAEEKTANDLTDQDTGIVRVINQIIVQAYQKGASDIHIEPYPGRRVDVRIRIDGEMYKIMELPAHFRNALVSRIKIMASLDIAERRMPQDGKIKFKKWGPVDIELRVATVPTTGGVEDVVLRILAASKPFPLDQMGMSKRNFTEFEKLIKTPYGIILCVGPTGSGKTTTLHSALGYINKPETKIWTAEDPVEITQEGLRQVHINRKAGMDFAVTMRAFLRADPDVIMVGEMRDLETTSTGIEASLTGHLVFSTLHTNNAPETVTRLLDLGIDEFTFADALLGVLAQRLARTLCKDCKEEHSLAREEYDMLRKEYGSEEFWDELKIPYSKELTLFKPREGGCEKCLEGGYRGRMGLHELMIKSDRIRDLIYERGQAEEIRKVSMAEGMRTLKQDGIEKILQGHSTLEKVLTVCKE